MREIGTRLTSSVSPIVAILGTVSALTFFIVATANGFSIPLLLVAVPLIAFLGILLSDLATQGKNKLSINASLGKFFQDDHYGLASVLLIAAVLHLLTVFLASYNPDEYGVWALLNNQPWLNLVEFLRRYDELAGLQRVHPPIGFLLMSLGYSVLGTIEGARLVSVVFGLASIPIVYWLALLFLPRKDTLIVSAIFALMPQTIYYMSLALTDTYVFFFGLLSLTAYASAVKRKSKSRLLVSGLCLGLAFWSKLAVPLLWAFAIMLSAFFLPWLSRLTRIIWAGFCTIVGLVIYALWGAVSPASFKISTEMLLNILLIRRFDIGSEVSGGIHVSISYQELLLELPIWFTSLVILFALLGIYAAIKERNREATWTGIWAMVPLLALIPYYHDMRYLLICSVPVAILALIGSGRVARNHRDALLGTVLVFLIIGSVSVMPIVQQEYAGLKESARIISELEIPQHGILTNALEIHFYLSDVQLIDLSSYQTEASIASLLATKNVTAVVIIHNQRGPWALPPPTIMNLLRAHFAHRITGGPSDFSWYEILY